MKRIIAALVLLFIAGAFSLFLIAQSGTEEVAFPDMLDPTAVEVNFTPTVLSQLVLLNNVTRPYDDADAVFSLNVVQETLDLLQRYDLPTFYVNDRFLEAGKAYEGENVTGIVEELLQIKDVKQRDRTLKKLNLTVNSTKINFDYDAVVQLSTNAVEHAQKLHTLQERITLLKYTLAQVNRSVYNITEMDFHLAAIADQFRKEQDLEGVGEMFTQAYARLDELLVEHSRAAVLLQASKRTLKNFIITNWKALLILLFVALIVGVIALNEIRIYLLEEKISHLQLESETLEKLVKKTQSDRYVEKSLTKSDYEVRMAQYKNRMTTISHTIPVVNSQLQKVKSYRKYYFPFIRSR